MNKPLTTHEAFQELINDKNINEYTRRTWKRRLKKRKLSDNIMIKNLKIYGYILVHELQWIKKQEKQ